tara:strand:+ start:63 stop:1346 length:1284 start_codon:yes stop_codon:yes gene_type:complete
MPVNLSPKSQVSAVILPSTGTANDVASAVPFGMYTGSYDFLSGAAVQVNYVYKKLGGDVVDIELTPANVYSAYEEAVLEYSYILNLHQAKNVLSDTLGDTTGTFNHMGVEQGNTPASASLRYPRFQYSYSRQVGDGMAAAVPGGLGGTIPQYSASFDVVDNKQDYDLQAIVEEASSTGTDDAGNPVDFSGKVGDSRIIITQVFYKSPASMWRFYGYYGGIGVVGNYSTYGQYADDSTFEIVPVWQNKLQAMMYEDAITTRISNFSYELINNRLRIYPRPTTWDMESLFNRVWFKFYVESNAWDEDDGYRTGVKGVNNMNTLPFGNLPYENINSIGKQWIRKYALALCKEMLGQIRGKFTTIPIPGQSVTLNFSELLSQAKEEQATLKDKLRELLKEMEYAELAKLDQEKADASAATLRQSPLPIFVG